MSFIKSLKKIINSGQSRSILLTGNIYDLFHDPFGSYVPLIPYLRANCKVVPTATQRGITQVIYELNNPIEIEDKDSFQSLWGARYEKKLDERLEESAKNETFALEMLRQMTELNRHNKKNNLLMIIEAADMLVPEAEISNMNITDRKRVAILQDWFSDPNFMAASDSVILLCESRSVLHHRIARLPQVLSVEVPLPDRESRCSFIGWMASQRKDVEELLVAQYGRSMLDGTIEKVGEQTSGLSLHAVRQLLLSGDLSGGNISSKVEEYMTSQLGEGVVEFQRPAHKLDAVVGFKQVKEFMRNDLIPSFLSGSISGAAVGGPIGGGKTFICEAVASELGVPVITLKNIRSKWFGETDQIFERLRRLLESFHKVVIFVDEADTQFGGVEDGHETERRLTGKIQAMMSDVRLKGRVIWFLMTARIHRLSPDIRRPGRMDLIIPILDPTGDDLNDFIRWTFDGIPNSQELCNDERIQKAVLGYSAASFSTLRSNLRSKKCDNIDKALEIAHDAIQPDIEETRRYQTLQALLNCTRRSLLPVIWNNQRTDNIEETKTRWKKELQELEEKGLK